jgi:ABC-type phosphate transport system permease subunit
MSETLTPATTVASAPVSLWRRGLNNLVTGLAVGAVILVLLPLGAIFGYLVYKGIGSINWAFLTGKPAAGWPTPSPAQL